MHTPRNVCMKHNRFTAIKYDGTNLRQVQEVLGYTLLTPQFYINMWFVTDGVRRYCMSEKEYHQQYAEVTQARDMIRIYSNQDGTLFVESYRYNPSEALAVLENLIGEREKFIDDFGDITTNIWVPKHELIRNIELRSRARSAGKPLIKKISGVWAVYYPDGNYSSHTTHREALHGASQFMKENAR